VVAADTRRSIKCFEVVSNYIKSLAFIPSGLRVHGADSSLNKPCYKKSAEILSPLLFLLLLLSPLFFLFL
jgi:hypothetical protein